ncbi:MAG: hypothetical protein KBS86_00835 [Proteobacteria bacterium]|nr:hypothetical protein [Candidatus Enterousia scatequi]
MKKIGFLGLLAGVLIVDATSVDAAYPVYQNGRAVSASAPVVYLPSNGNRTVAVNSAVAAQPTRITGALPRVGTAATTAGRQYYQPADYDRLADSGLYVGISAAYTASVNGGISADYAGESGSYDAPGAFREGNFKSDTVIPLQVSVGAAVNSDLRIDVSYLRYSGLSYPDSVDTADGSGGYVPAKTSGGAITANAAMLNIYYNIDSFTGYIAGGSLRPYIGGGVGVAFNTIADYVVYDSGPYYFVEDPSTVDPSDPNPITGVYDIYGYHNGGSVERLAFSLEAGVTADLSGGLKLDLFARYANLGKVQTSGSIVVSQTQLLATGMPPDYEAPYDAVFQFTNWYESGRLGMIDVGARLRLQF